MDTQLNPESPETVSEVKATQVANSETEYIPETENEAELQKQLNSHDFKERWHTWKKYLISVISVILVLHGLMNIYGETINVFYVLPHIPEVIEDTQYNNQVVTSFYRTVVLIISTASIETIYGLALMTRHKSSLSTIHLASGFCLFCLSFFIQQQGTSVEEFDLNNRIPDGPSIENLVQVRSWDEAVELFRTL